MDHRVPRSVWWVAGLGWLLFAAGILSFIFVYLRHGGSTVPNVRWRSRWGQPHRVTFQDPEGKFRLDYPSDWDASAPFERFTRHRVGSLVAVDTVALRHAHPTGLAVVIRYVAPGALSTADWLKLTRPGGPLSDAFGEKITSRHPARLADHEALHVVAEGVVVDQPYRLESWLIPAGAAAYRLTIGAPTTDQAAAPILHRIAASFRLTTPGAKVNSGPRSAEN
jgi:hypothetical protein